MPVKKFATFPLANQAEIADSGDTAIPTTEDVLNSINKANSVGGDK